MADGQEGRRLRRLARGAAAALAACLAVRAGAQSLPPAKPGFPATLAGEGAVEFSQPAIADLGLSADGTKSVVFGTRQGDLHVLYKNGAGAWVEAPGFPRAVGGPIHASPAVGDVDGNGIPDLVVGYGSNADLTKNGGVKAFTRTGALLWTVNTQDKVGPNGPDGRPDPVVSTPAIGDVDGDGKAEVAFGSFDFRIYLVQGESGASAAGWPKFIRDSVWSSPALHDIDGDGRPDIVIGVDAHAEPAPWNTPDGGCLHVLRFDSTQACPNPADPESCGPPTEVAGFPRCVDQVITSSPVVGDIDGDGKPEIVHGTGTFWPNRLERLYAWKCNGAAPAGWPVAIQGQSGFTNGLALADLDGDGDPEVVATADNTRTSGAFHLYAFRGDGSQLFAPRTVLDFFGVSASAGPPVVADVLGADGSPEILVPTNTSVAVFNAAGTLLTEHQGRTVGGDTAWFAETAVHGVAAGDFEDPAAAGAKIEVVAVSAAPFPDATNTKVYVWNPVSRSGVPPWGHFRRSPGRTGVVPGTPSCGASCAVPPAAADFFTVAPCRAVDTRRAAGPQGGPALASGARRTLPIAGSCGVPAGAVAVSVNVTVVQATAAGNIRLGPGGCASLPATSTINFGAGQTRANNALLALAVDGTGGLEAAAFVSGGGTVHLIVDVNGYFQ